MLWMCRLEIKRGKRKHKNRKEIPTYWKTKIAKYQNVSWKRVV